MATRQRACTDWLTRSAASDADSPNRPPGPHPQRAPPRARLGGPGRNVRRRGPRDRLFLAEGDALTGGQLWADRYDGRLDDIFAVQDKLVRVIVDALALKLSKDEEREIAPYLLISAGSA